MKPVLVTNRFEQLRETAGDFLAEASVERDQRLVRNVALLGPDSRNGYRYAVAAMQKAAPLYEGRPLFVDHTNPPPHGDGSPLQRSLRDYAGRVVQPRFENSRIRGDLHLLGANTDWLLSLIESAPSDVGMSHVVLARRSSAGDEVEHIERVLSVDIVAFPATTLSFKESEVRSAASGVERHEGTSDTALPDSELKRLVEQSRIPPLARTADLYQLLEKTAGMNPAALPELIVLLEAYWREALVDMPLSHEKAGPEQSTKLASPQLRKALVAAIRGD